MRTHQRLSTKFFSFGLGLLILALLSIGLTMWITRQLDGGGGCCQRGRAAADAGLAFDQRRDRGRLLKVPEQIVVGEVVRQMEEDFTMVECFSAEGSSCLIDGRCKLKGVLHEALQAYMRVLDGVRLSDLVAPGESLAKVTWR